MHCSPLDLSPSSRTWSERRVTGEALLRFVLTAADFMCCATADGRRRAARAARRWLARYAAGVKRISNQEGSDECYVTECDAPASACARLVSCLPALESADLRIYGPLDQDNVGCLLEALASCTALRALDLFLRPDHPVHAPQPVPASGCAPAFAKLRGLTKLALTLCDKYPYTLAEAIGPLLSLTGLVNLWIQQYCSYVSPDAVVPAALGQLKGLQILQMDDLRSVSLRRGVSTCPTCRTCALDGATLMRTTVMRTRMQGCCRASPLSRT